MNYLGDYMHFETLFLYVEMVLTSPPPIKCGKFHTFFEPFPK